MVTENDKWEEAKRQAKDLIEKSPWSNNIRFMMALRDILQKNILAYYKRKELK